MTERNRYSKEFKLEAIRLLEQGDQPAAEVARQLGIRRNQLYKWQRELADKGSDEAFQGSGRRAKKELAADELDSLRQKVAQLEEENAILKKAAVYFAKELQ